MTDPNILNLEDTWRKIFKSHDGFNDALVEIGSMVFICLKTDGRGIKRGIQSVVRLYKYYKVLY